MQFSLAVKFIFLVSAFIQQARAQLDRLPAFPERGRVPEARSQAQFTALSQPIRALQNSQGDLGARVFSLQGRAPLPTQDPAFIGYGWEERENLGTGSLDNGQVIPKRFRSPQLSGSWGHYRSLADSEGVAVTVGSPSDQPFSSLDVVSVNATYVRRYGLIPGADGRQDSWYWALNYSNVRPFLNNIPIPGVGYEWHRENWTWLLGAPFIAGFGSPWAKSFMSVSMFPPFQVNFSLTQFVLGPVQIYTQWVFRDQFYILRDRGLALDRYVVSERSAALGVRAPLSRSVLLSLEYIHYFRLMHRVQVDVWDFDLGPRARVDRPGPGVMLTARGLF